MRNKNINMRNKRNVKKRKMSFEVKLVFPKLALTSSLRVLLNEKTGRQSNKSI